MLRIIRLRERTIDEAPVSLDRGYALDHCLRREGWIAFRPNLDVWGIPVPISGDPFLVEKSARWVAGRDPATVWIDPSGPNLAEGARVRLYDGSARCVRGEVSLPDGFRLTAEIDEGFVLEDMSGRLSLWTGPDAPEPVLDGLAHAEASSGLLFAGHAADDYDELAIGDLATGEVVTVPCPEDARWDFLSAAFSPDGRRLAVGLDYSQERTHERSPHGLAIVGSDGGVTLVEGQYDNFARPVWSNDGVWIVFKAPFEPRGLWLTSVAGAKLRRIPFERNAPVPLVDVSDLLS